MKPWVQNPRHQNDLMRTIECPKKRALVVPGRNANFYKEIASTFGWDINVGEDQFVNIPYWWVLDRVETSSLLANSIAMLKLFSFLYYFTTLARSKRLSCHTAMIQEDFIKSNGKSEQESSSGTSVPMEDSLTSEAFVLFLYGALTAGAAFVCEQGWQVSLSDMS